MSKVPLYKTSFHGPVRELVTLPPEYRAATFILSEVLSKEKGLQGPGHFLGKTKKNLIFVRNHASCLVQNVVQKMYQGSEPFPLD